MGSARRILPVGIAFALAAAPLLWASNAGAEPPGACFEAPLRGQSLRDEAKLREARAAFLSCAAESCPKIIKHDCAQWLAEVDARMPTIIVSASDPAGHELIDVRLLAGGQELAKRLDGIAVPIDPGVHSFRFEPSNGTPLERQVVVRDGEKFQRIHVVVNVTPAPVAEPPPRAPGRQVGMPVGAIVAGSLGALALGTFAYFGATGASEVNHLDRTCAPRCAHDDAEAARRQLLVADVALGVGAVAVAVATWLYVRWHSAPTATAGAAAWGRAIEF